MKGSQAIPPSAQNLTIAQFIEKIKDVKIEEIAEKSKKDDELVAELATSQAFDKFKQIVQERISYLLSLIDPDSKNSMIDLNDTPEKIGVKYLIVTFAADQIKKIINIPESISNARATNQTNTTETE